MTAFTRMKRLWKQEQGTTLVELMVAFLLTAILMTAAIATISPAMRVFNKVVGMSRAQGITDILLEEISGELEAAGKIMSIGGSKITYSDKNGQGVTMLLGTGKTDGEQSLDGMLVLHYSSEDVQWYLPEKTYMGFQITSLSFSQIDKKNLIEVKIEVKSSRSGITYGRTKIVQCYKLGDEEIPVTG